MSDFKGFGEIKRLIRFYLSESFKKSKKIIQGNQHNPAPGQFTTAEGGSTSISAAFLSVKK